jgi:SOS-response transcriptional repressor LexA
MPDQRHRWVVDSIEESVASIEVDGKDMITVPLSLLPDGLRDGDVLRVQVTRPAKARSVLTIDIDAKATTKALAESDAQVKKHANQPNDPGGDITL